MIKFFISPIRLPVILAGVLSFLFILSGVTFSPTGEADKLVVAVAEWRQAGGNSLDIQHETYHRLVQKLNESDMHEVEVITIPVVLQNAGTVDIAAEAYSADVLVWGWYDETAVRGYVDLANATEENGMTNSLAQFLENGGSTEAIRVLRILSNFEYGEDGVSFCVPRWTP